MPRGLHDELLPTVPAEGKPVRNRRGPAAVNGNDASSGFFGIRHCPKLRVGRPGASRAREPEDLTGTTINEGGRPDLPLNRGDGPRSFLDPGAFEGEAAEGPRDLRGRRFALPWPFRFAPLASRLAFGPAPSALKRPGTPTDPRRGPT